MAWTDAAREASIRARQAKAKYKDRRGTFSKHPAMVNQIVGRLHVDTSNRAAIKYVVSRMAKGYKTFHAMPRAARRDLMRATIKSHAANRSLFARVLRGTPSRHGASISTSKWNREQKMFNSARREIIGLRKRGK